ncbi:hypothetical protein VXL51_06995 [Phaeobacter sp. JH20_17]
MLVSIETGAIAKLVYGCGAASTAFPTVNGCLLNSEKLFSQLQRKGGLIFCLKLPFNDRSDDIGCTAAMMVPHLRAHAASATCQNANVGFVRSSDLATDNSERLVIEYSARRNFCSLMAPLSLSELVVHLFEAVVALIVTPIDEDRSVVDTRAILAPTFETDMGLGQGSYG